MRSFVVVVLLLVWTRCWINSRDARDMKNHDAYVTSPSYGLFTCMFGVLHWKWVNHTIACHDDVTKWKHFPLPGNSLVTSESSAQRPVTGRGALMYSLICAWTNGCTNNPDSDDLRQHHAYCDVTVMTAAIIWLNAQAPVNSSRKLCVMMTSSNRNILRVAGSLWGEPPVTSGFQRPVMRNFDVFYDVRLNKRLIIQSRCQWFETPWRSLWRHWNVKIGCYRKTTEHTLVSPVAGTSLVLSIWNKSDLADLMVRYVHVSPTKLCWRYHSLPMGQRSCPIWERILATRDESRYDTKYEDTFVSLDWKQLARKLEFPTTYYRPTCLTMDSGEAYCAGTIVSVHCICAIGAILTWHTEAFINVCKNTWWCNDIETLSGLMALCEGNPPVTKGFPSQWACDAEHRCCNLGLVWTSCLINRRVVGHPKRHLAYVKPLLWQEKCYCILWLNNLYMQYTAFNAHHFVCFVFIGFGDINELDGSTWPV